MLRGARTVLAPVREGDSEQLFDWINERSDVLLNASYRPVHFADHAEWFDRIRKAPDVVLFAIRTLDDDDLIGTCQLHTIDMRGRSAELQIRIGKPGKRGRGHGHEAVALLLRHGFSDLNLHRVYLHVFATNARAIDLYRRIGFAEEGCLRDAAFLDGSYTDVLVMGILEDEFEAAAPGS